MADSDTAASAKADTLRIRVRPDDIVMCDQQVWGSAINRILCMNENGDEEGKGKGKRAEQLLLKADIRWLDCLGPDPRCCGIKPSC